MINIADEVFDTVAKAVRSIHYEAKISGEYMHVPPTFPTVTLDEIQNTVVGELEDSSKEETYAGVVYRLQVFSNKQNGKKAEARAIFATADEVMRRLGLRRVTYTTTPEIYDSTIYSITATYEAIVDVNGVVYRR